MKTASAHLPRVVGYATVAAMLPYLAIKTAWILGSEIGVAEPGLMRTTPFVVGNLLTAGMELAGAGLALALVHRWGQRTPTWLLLFPMGVASGLLAPVMLAAPLGFLAESLTGMGATGGLDAGDGPASGLQGWVYAVVYTGFTLQGAGLAVAFAPADSHPTRRRCVADKAAVEIVDKAAESLAGRAGNTAARDGQSAWLA
jgi:hypothetical protein